MNKMASLYINIITSSTLKNHRVHKSTQQTTDNTTISQKWGWLLLPVSLMIIKNKYGIYRDSKKLLGFSIDIIIQETYRAFKKTLISHHHDYAELSLNTRLR